MDLILETKSVPADSGQTDGTPCRWRVLRKCDESRIPVFGEEAVAAA